MTVLTSAQRHDYADNGYLYPIDVCTSAESGALRREFEAAELAAQGDADRTRTLRSTANMVVPMIDRMMRDPRITDAVADILGPDVLCWGCNLFVKEPHTPAFVSWHQDLHYWGLSDNSAEVTAWLALSTSDEESGCVRFVRGSHKTVVAHAETDGGANMLSRGQEVAVEVDENMAVHVVLRPGQMSLHHGLVFHSSGPNRSNDRRIGIAMRYVSTAMSNIGEARTDAFLVRGEDRHGHFDLAGPPRGLFDASDVALAKRSIEKQYVYKLGAGSAVQ